MRHVITDILDICVVPYSDFNLLLPRPDSVAVRIHSRSQRLAPISYRYKDSICVAFDDIVEPEPGMALFTRNMAKRLVDFFNKHKNVKNFIIHCDTGLSRAPAVAMGLAYYRMDMEAMDELARFFPMYNSTVRSVIIREIEGVPE